MFLKPYNPTLYINLSAEAQSVSPRTGKQIKGTLPTLVRDQMLNCDHTVA